MRAIARLLAVVSVVFTLAGNAQAREVVPVVDYLDIPVATATGNAISADRVRDAIIAAATAKKWEIARGPSQDVLTASLSWNGKHTITVSIPYTVERFSLRYQSSVNMKYTVSQTANQPSTPLNRIGAPTSTLSDGVPMIHPRYNEYVQQLLRGIQAELMKL